MLPNDGSLRRFNVAVGNVASHFAVIAQVAGRARNPGRFCLMMPYSSSMTILRPIPLLRAGRGLPMRCPVPRASDDPKTTMRSCCLALTLILLAAPAYAQQFCEPDGEPVPYYDSNAGAAIPPAACAAAKSRTRPPGRCTERRDGTSRDCSGTQQILFQRR